MASLRERILTVFRGGTPDVVPFMLDLSHWFYHKTGRAWDLSQVYTEPERELIDYHRENAVGFYVANNAAFWSQTYRHDVSADVRKSVIGGAPEIAWTLDTPLGTIRRSRRWSEQTYSWHVSEWVVKTEADLRVFEYAMTGCRFVPHWERYREWKSAVGDVGVVYMPVGYSAMGHLFNLWMGIEGAIMATYEWTETMREVVDRVNANLLNLVDLLADSPAEIVIMGDNFSSDLQPPHFFAEWSRRFYEEAIRRLHGAGKSVCVHIDGRLKGAIQMIRDAGADGGDAITPAPMGDLSAAECRQEAGQDFILSGGVSPEL